MRVCFYHASPEWSGSSRAFADAATVLKDRGYEVTITCAREGGVDRRFEESGVRVVALRPGGGWLRSAWRLRAVLRRQFVEVVFVHGEREQLIAAAAVRLADRGAIIRRVPPLGRLSMGRDAVLAMRLAATGFLFSFDEDLRSAKPPPRALEPVVAPPGVAPAAPAPGSATDVGAATIAVVFDESRRARVSIALRTLALLSERHPRLRFVLLGPGHGADALRLQAAALGVARSVEVVDDRVGRKAVQGRISAMDLGWVLAGGDAAAYGVLDCLAAGVPVLTDRDPLSARLVEDGVSGLLVAGLDTAGFSSLLASLLADPSRRARLARAARTASERWPLAAMADGFERATVAARDRTRWRV